MKKPTTVDPEQYLRESVSIDETNLNAEYIRIPTDLAYWSAQYALAVRRFHTAKLEADRVTARARIDARLNLETMHTRVTESMVEAAVEKDGQVFAMATAAIEAEAEKLRLQGVVDAVRAKRDMVISLGATQRQEMQADPTLRALARG